jgi:hypothetical protein
MKNIFEHFNLYTEARGYGLGTPPKEIQIFDFCRQFYDMMEPDINKLLQKLYADIVKNRPTPIQGVKNWWDDVKKVVGRTGKYRNEAYNAELYNLSNSYFNKIYEETNIMTIERILFQFRENLKTLMIRGLAQAFKTGLTYGQADATTNRRVKAPPATTQPAQPAPVVAQPQPQPPNPFASTSINI